MMTLQELQLVVGDPGRSDHLDVLGPNGNKIARNAKPEDITAFLNTLMRQYGYPNLIVRHYKPNGTSRRKLGEYKWDGTDLTPIQVQQKPKHRDSFFHGTYPDPSHFSSPSPYPPAYPFGMQAPFPGLNDPAQRQALVKMELFDKVERERDYYKEKYEELREEVIELKRKLDIIELERKFKDDGQIKEIVKTIAETAMEHYGKKKQSAPGLQAPENPVLAEICQTMGNLNPAHLPEFRNLINAMISNAEFLEEIRAMEEKYGLIKRPEKQTNNEPGSH